MRPQPLSVLSRANDDLFGIAQATLMSATICNRGCRAFQAAAVGLAWMSYEDCVRIARTLATVRTPAALVELELNVVRSSVGRAVCHSVLLSTMAMEIAEDAVSPYSQHAHRVFDEAVSAAAA